MKRIAALAVASGCFFPSVVATAQQQPGIPLERFYPSWAGDRFFAVPTPWALGNPGIHAKLVADYALNPLELTEQNAAGDDVDAFIVRHQLHGRLNGTFALWHRMAINLDIPVAFVQEGDDATLPSGTYVGAQGLAASDVRIGLRGRIYGEDDAPIQFGLGGNLWLPVGPDNPGDTSGAGGVRGRVLLNAGGTLDRFVWAFDLGPELAPARTYAGIAQGAMLRYGLAAGYLLGEAKNLQLSAEAYGTMVFDDPRKENTNFELLFGGKYHFNENFAAGLAAGPGIPRSIGTPNFRGVFSLEFSIQPGQGDGDRDGDGIPDGDDACPDKKGRASSNPLKHGCPRREDRDFDLIWDDEDACPDTPGVESDDPAKN
ncbi:MAG TPA: porin, partial [Sorangium sp.]|nr:porin [Sorangium sp.]